MVDARDDNDLERMVESITAKGPDLLWHYTTPEGLLGILRSGELFATGLPYLNDSTEGSYMTELTLKKLAKRMPTRMAKVVRISLNGLTDHRPLAVTCFCKHGDLLGQWRAYTGGRGFAIGFDTKALGSYWTVTQREGLLARVQYKNERSSKSASRYAKIIHTAWNDLVAERLETSGQPPSEAEVEAVAEAMFEFTKRVGYLSMSGAFHKPPHFSQEQEWRFVTSLAGRADSGMTRDPAQFEERATPFGIAVYRRVAFQDSPATSPIRAIRIGPGLDVDSQTATLERVLAKIGYTGMKIDGSTVPLRF